MLKFQVSELGVLWLSFSTHCLMHGGASLDAYRGARAAAVCLPTALKTDLDRLKQHLFFEALYGRVWASDAASYPRAHAWSHCDLRANIASAARKRDRAVFVVTAEPLLPRRELFFSTTYRSHALMLPVVLLPYRSRVTCSFRECISCL